MVLRLNSKPLRYLTKPRTSDQGDTEVINFYLLACQDKFQTVLRSLINRQRSGLTFGCTCFSILGNE